MNQNHFMLSFTSEDIMLLLLETDHVEGLELSNRLTSGWKTWSCLHCHLNPLLYILLSNCAFKHDLHSTRGKCCPEVLKTTAWNSFLLFKFSVHYHFIPVYSNTDAVNPKYMDLESMCSIKCAGYIQIWATAVKLIVSLCQLIILVVMYQQQDQ